MQYDLEINKMSPETHLHGYPQVNVDSSFTKRVGISNEKDNFIYEPSPTENLSKIWEDSFKNAVSDLDMMKNDINIYNPDYYGANDLQYKSQKDYTDLSGILKPYDYMTDLPSGSPSVDHTSTSDLPSADHASTSDLSSVDHASGLIYNYSSIFSIFLLIILVLLVTNSVFNFSGNKTTYSVNI